MGKIPTINVIETIDGKIHSLQAFPENKYCIPQAQTLFKSLALEHGASNIHLEVYVEDGYYERGNYMISLVHSS